MITPIVGKKYRLKPGEGSVAGRDWQATRAYLFEIEHVICEKIGPESVKLKITSDSLNAGKVVFLGLQTFCEKMILVESD